jgi:hypothetical protein
MLETGNRGGNEINVIPEFEGVKMELLVRQGKDDEDKVWSSETAGAAAVIDMMGGHAKGIRVGMIKDKGEKVYDEISFGKEVLNKHWTIDDLEGIREIKEEFERWGSSAGSWVGDKTVNGFARALSRMRGEFGSEQEVEMALRAIARGVNQVIHDSNEQLAQFFSYPVNAGGVGVFGKIVMIQGERCFVGLRNGDARVGIKKKEGEVEFERNEGESVESYVKDCNDCDARFKVEEKRRKAKRQNLSTFWNTRNRVNTAFQGKDGDVNGCEFFALNVEKGDEIILLTDGITDSLEYVDGGDPWQKIKAIWNKAKPGSLLQDLANEARRLESERTKAVAEGKTRPNTLLVIEGCLPKGYGDDQGGILIRVGREPVAEGQEITAENYQQVLMGRIGEIREAIQEGKKVSVEKALASMIADVAGAREVGADSEHIDKIMKPVLKLATMVYDV